MRLKDAVRMVELGGRTEQHDAVRSSIGVQAVAGQFQGVLHSEKSVFHPFSFATDPVRPGRVG